MPLPDMPEQNRLAEAVVRGLGERAGGTRRRSCNCRTSLPRCASWQLRSWETSMTTSRCWARVIGEAMRMGREGHTRVRVHHAARRRGGSVAADSEQADRVRRIAMLIAA